jgi:hypothetical protein
MALRTELVGPGKGKVNVVTLKMVEDEDENENNLHGWRATSPRDVEKVERSSCASCVR